MRNAKTNTGLSEMRTGGFVWLMVVYARLENELKSREQGDLMRLKLTRRRATMKVFRRKGGAAALWCRKERLWLMPCCDKRLLGGLNARRLGLWGRGGCRIGAVASRNGELLCVDINIPLPQYSFDWW
jgi:hypothetical protein